MLIEDVHLSIIIPMFNEEECIGPLLSRLYPVLTRLDITYEVIAINDGSTDKTLSILTTYATKQPGLKIIDLARNSGQHAAIRAGFHRSSGRWLVTLDADLQNPPEEIPNIVAALRRGHDLVNTYRQGRDDPMSRLFVSRFANTLVRRWTKIKLKDFGCMLRGYSRDLIKTLSAQRDYQYFIPAMAMVYSRNPTEIAITHEAREYGDSKYSLTTLFYYFLDLVTGFSLAPLRLLFASGVTLVVFSLLSSAVLVATSLTLGNVQLNFYSLAALITIALSFFTGLQLFALGLIGEYVGRSYHQVKPVPSYVIKKHIQKIEPNSSDTRQALQTQAAV